ncbi:oligosaccharide repeat unit polymerase family protein [Mycobacterium sp. SMC-4]|nr:oligosaccharide repeat unit polymerase family protein [Mycobacterium sp. SMC-4]
MYFAVGSMNLAPFRGRVGPNVLWLAAGGLVCFGLGVWARTLVSARPTSDANAASSRVVQDVAGWRAAAVPLGLTGVAAAIGIVAQLGELPILAGDRRMGASGYLSTLLTGCILALVITGGHALATRKWRLIAYCVLGSGLLIILGYRTFLLVPLLTLFFTARNLGMVRLKARWWLAGGILLYILSWLAFYRFGAGKDALFRSLMRLGMPPEYRHIIPIWMTPYEGTAILGRLMDRFPANWDYQRGQLFLSTFETVLPGPQPGARTLIAEYVGGRPGVTITPSILGQPYVDFGVVGVAVYMLLVGFALKSIWIWQASSLTWAPRVAAAYVLVVLLLSIHNGLFDLSMILSSLFMLWWARHSEMRAVVVGDFTTKRAMSMN